MQRPRSIAIFEACYLGAWVLGMLNLALTWNDRVEQANIAAAQRGGMAPPTSMIMIGGIVISALITLALWYYVARRGAAVAKWITVVLIALGLLSVLVNLARGAMPAGAGAALTIIASVMQVVAAVMLFRPDASAWFAQRSGRLS